MRRHGTWRRHVVSENVELGGVARDCCPVSRGSAVRIYVTYYDFCAERVLQQPFKGQQDVTQELQQQCVGVTISVPIQERAKQALLEVEILIQDGKSDDSDQTENEELLKSVQDLLAQADAELQS